MSRPAAVLAAAWVSLAPLLSPATAGAASADAHDAAHVDAGDRARSPTSPDDLFPTSGTFSASFASGIPLLAIGEVTYGFTDRFSTGALIAATPDMGSVRGTAAIGVRPRAVVFDTGAWRSALVVPLLYYPKVDGFGGRDAWVLTRPTLLLESRLGPAVRVDAGLGLIAAACTESLLTLGAQHTMMGGVWNTASVGGAVALSPRTSLFGEASLVMHGAAPAADWIGASPVIAFVGVSTAL